MSVSLILTNVDFGSAGFDGEPGIQFQYGYIERGTGKYYDAETYAHSVPYMFLISNAVPTTQFSGFTLTPKPGYRIKRGYFSQAPVPGVTTANPYDVDWKTSSVTIDTTKPLVAISISNADGVTPVDPANVNEYITISKNG